MTRVKSKEQEEPSAESPAEMPEVDFSKGKRTGRFAARIAKEGYTVHVTSGRPKKGEETGTVTKTVRLPPDVWERVEDKAREAGLSVHAFVRRAVLAAL